MIWIVVSCGAPAQRDKSNASQHAGEHYRSFGSDGAWCWFSDPRAIYYEGNYRRTYTGWVDGAGSVIVAYYDHDTGETSQFTLHEKLQRDDHNNPSFLVDEEGRLMVFYTRHSKRTPIYLARSAAPETINAWEPVRELSLNDTTEYAGFSDTYTYTNIVRLSEEKDRLFLFWRGSDFKPNVSTSEDHGETWGKGKILVLPERIYRNRRPYLKVHGNDRDAIHFAFTDGHPNAEPSNSIYYMKYRKGRILKASGEVVRDWSELPVDPAEVDVVYDAKASGDKAWVWDVAENAEGAPVIVYVTFPTDTNHVYHYATYESGQWHNHRVVDSGSWFPHTPEGATEREPYYSGGIVLDHYDPSQVYLSREANGVFEIEHWSTPDHGKTWQTSSITAQSTFDNVRPFVVRNHPGDSMRVLWMNVRKYLHFTEYESDIKMSIPVTRDTQETARR